MNRNKPRAGSHRRSQRGAAAVFAAISILAGLIAVGLAIDLGRLFFAQRDLQRLANMAALDSARIAGGCMGELPDPAAAALGEALNSVLRNGGQTGWVASTPGNVLGRMESIGGLRSFEAIPDSTNRAVQVQLSRLAPPRLIPLLTDSGDVRLNAAAAAYNTPAAFVKVGSKPLNIQPGAGTALNNLFRQLFGGPVSIDVLSYEALLEAEVPIGEVLENLGLADANTPTSLTDLILAVVNAIGDPVALAAAQNLYAAADGARVVVPGALGINETAAGSFASAGDILVAAAAASLDGSPITVPVNLPPPLEAGSTTLRLLDPGLLARLVPGGQVVAAQNFAHNSSVVLESDAPLNIAGGIVGRLKFFIQAGQSTVEVQNINCARRGEPLDTVDVGARSSVIRLGIGQFDNINSPNPQPQAVTVVDINLGLARVRIDARSIVDVGSDSNEILPGMEEGETRRIGTPAPSALANALLDISRNLELTTCISALGQSSCLGGGLLFNSVIGSANNLLTPVRQALNAGLLPLLDGALVPQLEALGVTLGGADVTVEDIDAEQPLLFTH